MRRSLSSATLILVVTSIALAQQLRIEGSTTVGPIADAFADYFKSIIPGLQITVNKTGSGNAAAALIDGRCDIAAMSRFMKPEEEFKKATQKGVMPVAHLVAMDGICLIVHPSNPISELTIAQVRDIYLGKIRNWQQLGGPDMTIVAVSRDTASGTYECFHELVMHKEDMAQSVEYVSANPQAHTRVSTTPGAIGYVGLGFVDAKVKALKIDGVYPSKKTIVSGQYPLARPLFFFTNGFPELGSISYRFVTFYLTEKGQELIEAKGFVPVTDY
ncbi:MAG: phosphate ABC transporter substrate-binding protein [Sedimentisphaerales bacterium]|nr:phosphate ABC transporter substrate-binding protein [Sedimentisphaerales bacterium]